MLSGFENKHLYPLNHLIRSLRVDQTLLLLLKLHITLHNSHSNGWYKIEGTETSILNQLCSVLYCKLIFIRAKYNSHNGYFTLLGPDNGDGLVEF